MSADLKTAAAARADETLATRDEPSRASHDRDGRGLAAAPAPAAESATVSASAPTSASASARTSASTSDSASSSAPSDDRDDVYAEYVRDLEDLPLLTDPIAIPPRRALPPDFRRGERKDVRKRPREDALTVRESAAREHLRRYDEYVQPAAQTPAHRKNRKQRRRGKKGR